MVVAWIVNVHQLKRPRRGADRNWSRRRKHLRSRIRVFQSATVIVGSIAVLSMLGIIMTTAGDTAAQNAAPVATEKKARKAKDKTTKKKASKDKTAPSLAGGASIPSDSSSSSSSALLPSSSSSSSASASSSSEPAASSSSPAASSSQPTTPATATPTGAYAKFANTLNRAVSLSGGTVTAMNFPASADGSVSQVVVTVSGDVSDANANDKTEFCQSALTEVKRVANEYGVTAPPVLVKGPNGTTIAKSNGGNTQMELQ
ncbi:hypothetical protein L248_1471 [Schleiferilactobacillus shenzhenensis LY-73]|uniref:Uncharacterized protein n=1 Tax=Schleiferilactobacillus shenzhenensis LY-73 TaxID=1231336 RepID=U4TQL2_9LACO|nr:hypothetical protein L248_1471 [Schleiferilactobacillus shenzhenensis LY-73]